MKDIIVGYDGYIIYRIDLKDQKKVITVEHLFIFENYETKSPTKLFDYNKDTPIFEKFLFADNDNKQFEDNMLLTHASGRNVSDIKSISGQKVLNTKIAN